MIRAVCELLFVLCVVSIMGFGARMIVETMVMIAVEIWHLIKDFIEDLF